MDADLFVQQVIEAHGGVSLWGSLGAIEADISARGALFTLKHRPALTHMAVTASAREPRFWFHDFPSQGLVGELIGDKEVRIISKDGSVKESREDPRSAFRGFRRMIYWDVLDFTYFGGYATWNYLLTPFLFLGEGFRFEILKTGAKIPSGWTRLQVTFPPDVPTHSRKQIFHFDKDLHLRRVDYTAEVVGTWARAAHICEEYREFDGIKLPTRRRVYPLFFGDKPLPGPTLVALDIHSIRPVWDSAA
jgi:hypothetical protein